MTRTRAALLLLAVLPALGAQRYVSPGGSDQNPCTQSSPCASVQAGLAKMQDGDTLILADGVYTSNAVAASGCGFNHTSQLFVNRKDCPGGCTIKAANIDPVNPRVVLAGGETGYYVRQSDGWTIEGIRFDAPAGVYSCGSTDLTVRDSVVEFQQEPARTYFGAYIVGMTNLALERVRIYEKTRPCWIRQLGPDTSTHRGMLIRDSVNVTIDDSYLGYVSNLVTVTNVQNLSFRRTRFQHWAEHGFTVSAGSKNLLLENVVWGGTTWGHCWNGSDQSTLTDTQCRANADCAGEPASARVCRVDDCFCTQLNVDDPPYCGTCDASPDDPWDTCWRGPRSLDLYEVQGLVVRNNTWVGHGYMPISAVYRNFTAHNAYSNCTHYPGACELDASRSCTESQGDTFCGGLGLGRCIPTCKIEDYKFYNNLVYDMAPLELMKSPSYVRVPGDNEWNDHSNLRFDGNLYSGGQQLWQGCGTEREIAAARFGPNDPGVCWTPGDLNSFTGELCFADSDCTRGRCNNEQWQGALCHDNPVDPSGHWYLDIRSSFAGYGIEDYHPSSPTAVMVNAGIQGVDPDGVPMCAVDDFDGNPRTDGQCDVGAFELRLTNDDGQSGEVPDPVTGLRRTDVVDPD